MKVYYKIRNQLIKVALLAVLLGFCGCQETDPSKANLPKDCRQVLMVVGKGWDDQTAKLQRFEKIEDEWRPVGRTLPVSLGRSGMGVGRGVRDISNFPGNAPRKKEGDGRSPAGIFTLGTTFGYEPGPSGFDMPYMQATVRDFFVDDSFSPEYNQWVRLEDGEEPTKRWQTFEYMKRGDQLYELGIVVNHNTNPAVPKAGSAIFLHIWGGTNKPTAGCTAMEKAHLLELLHWLSDAYNPVLIQLPQEVFVNGEYANRFSF